MLGVRFSAAIGESSAAGPFLSQGNADGESASGRRTRLIENHLDNLTPKAGALTRPAGRLLCQAVVLVEARATSSPSTKSRSLA